MLIRQTDPTQTLYLTRDGSWFQLNHQAPVDLHTRKSLRLILAALAEVHATAPGTRISRREVFRVGWPGEHAYERAAGNRVYTSVFMLRKMGLDRIIVHRGGGYRLNTNVQIVWLDAAPAPQTIVPPPARESEMVVGPESNAA